MQGLFQPDGSYTRPAEDPVTMWAIDLLHRQYNVPLEAMQLELSIEFSEGTRTSGRGYFGRADLTIYDDRYQNELDNLDVAFIMVEAMEPGKKFEGDEDLGWNYHLKQLNSYMSASPSARYAILTSGQHTIIYRRDLEYPRALQPIADLPLKAIPKKNNAPKGDPKFGYCEAYHLPKRSDFAEIACKACFA